MWGGLTANAPFPGVAAGRLLLGVAAGRLLLGVAANGLLPGDDAKWLLPGIAANGLRPGVAGERFVGEICTLGRKEKHIRSIVSIFHHLGTYRKYKCYLPVLAKLHFLVLQ